MDQTLEGIYSQLKISECKVLTGVTATVNTTLGIFQGCRRWPSYSENFGGGIGVPILSENILFSDPVFQAVPDGYHFASMVSVKGENRDKGKTPAVLFEDQSVELSLSKIFTFFDQWRENNQSINGYDLTGLSSQKVIELDIENGLGENGGTISLFTDSDNDGSGTQMIRSHNIFRNTSYPGLDREWVSDGIIPNFKRCVILRKRLVYQEIIR